MAVVFLIIISTIVNYQYTRTEISSLCREIGKENKYCEDKVMAVEAAKKNINE